MGSKGLGKVPEEVADKYMDEAQNLGLNRSEYIRNCIEIGRMIFQSSGELDVKRLRELTEDTNTTSVNSDLTTTNGDLGSTILNNLPTEEHRALTKDELRVAIFGTKNEQMEQISNTLKELNQQGEIQPLVEDGYIKTND